MANNLIKYLSLSFLSMLFILSSAYDITSNAFNLDLDQNAVILSDDVQIKTNEYYFNSNKATMTLDDKKISISEPFKIKYLNQIVNGEKLWLDTDNSLLTANNVSLIFSKYTLDGERVYVKTGELMMDNVLITSCQGKKPLIFLKSGKVVVYPQFGFIVAFNSVLYFSEVPIMYFPAYFMGDRRYSAFAQNNLVPEIGSNAAEGSYIKENLPYYLNATNHGTFHVGLIEKFGLKTGVQHYFLLDEGKQKGTVGIYYSPKTWQGNLSYTISLLNEITKDKYFLSFLFDDVSTRKKISNLYFTGALNYQELNNNQFVNILPSLKVSGYVDVDKENDLNLSYELAEIQENSVTTARKIAFEANLQSNYAVQDISIHNSLTYVRNHYLAFDMHERVQDNISFRYPFIGLLWTVDYEHLFLFVGSSPFLYDLFKMDTYDKIGLASKIHFDFFDLEFSVRKRIDTEYYYYKKIEVTLPYEHCLDFKLYWEDVEKIFGMSVQI